MNLDGADLRQVDGARSKLNGYTIIDYRDRESLVDSGERSSGRGNNIKVGQDRVRISRTAGMHEYRAERRKERDGSAGSLRGVCRAGCGDVHRLACGDGRRCGVETGCRSRCDKRSDLRAVGPGDAKVGRARNRCCKLLTLRGKRRSASRAWMPMPVPALISMALIFGKSADPVVNWIVIELPVTVTGKDLSIAVKAAPAAATISKFFRTYVPLIEVLKSRLPVVVQ